jgi:Tfp pilus assembly protein PilF
MRTTMKLLVLLLLATGCQSGRNGIMDRAGGRLARTLGMSKETPPDNLTAARSIEDLPLAQARGLERKGEFARAEAIYHRALESNPRQAIPLHRLAVIADRRGQFEKSAHLFEQALALEPSNPDIHCDYGYSLYRQEKWQESEAHFQRALALDAEHARAENNYGLLLARTGRPNEALDAFRRAGCGKAESRMNLAFVLASEGLTDLAQQQLDQARQTFLVSSVTKERMEELEHWIAQTQATVPDMPMEPEPHGPAYRYAQGNQPPPPLHGNEPPFDAQPPPGESATRPITSRR